MKRKEKENKHVVGREAMKAAKKTKEEWFGKQNRKEEACSKEDETRVNKEDSKNTDEKIEGLLFKIR